VVAVELAVSGDDLLPPPRRIDNSYLGAERSSPQRSLYRFCVKGWKTSRKLVLRLTRVYIDEQRSVSISACITISFADCITFSIVVWDLFVQVMKSSSFEGILLKATWPSNDPVPAQLLTEIIKYSIPAFKFSRQVTPSLHHVIIISAFQVPFRLFLTMQSSLLTNSLDTLTHTVSHSRNTLTLILLPTLLLGDGQDSEDDPYYMTMHKLWTKICEPDWRTVTKSLYIVHCISRDSSVEACKRFASVVK
jgi:hypothetical protein